MGLTSIFNIGGLLTYSTFFGQISGGSAWFRGYWVQGFDWLAVVNHGVVIIIIIIIIIM